VAMAILGLQNVTLSFGGLFALKNVSLAVEEKELLGIIGPNGSGKSSLFNVITGLYQPNKGSSVFFKGNNIVGKSMHHIVRSGIYRTFQNIQLFDRLTVIENVILGQYRLIKAGVTEALFGGKKLREQEKKQLDTALELLALVELEDKKDFIAGSLSYGDQRKVEIARALAGQPDLLLLDEPAAGLNSSEKETAMRLIKNINLNKKVTVILVEHNMRLLMGISERVIVLNQGEIIAKGTPKEIQENQMVIEAYLGTTEH